MIRPINDKGAGTDVKGQAAVGPANVQDTMCRALYACALPAQASVGREAAAQKGLTLNAEQLKGGS